jgi:hypothetical protein
VLLEAARAEGLPVLNPALEKEVAAEQAETV